MLQAAYMRRQRWLARVQAVAVVNTYAEALKAGQAPEIIEADAFLALAGGM